MTNIETLKVAKKSELIGTKRIMGCGLWVFGQCELVKNIYVSEQIWMTTKG